MKKFAKLLSMVLAVAMVLTMFVGAFEYKDDAAIDEDKAEAVSAVYDYGVMQGNDKGEFNPKGYLTRDEMSKIMYALAAGGWTTPASYYAGFLTAFADGASVPNWSKSYMGYAYISSIFIGNDQNKINALGNLSYVQAAIVLLRSMKVETADDTYKVGDVEYGRYEGPKWFNNAVGDGAQAGLFEGLDITDFKANITREDVAVMVYNAIESAAKKAEFKLATPASGVVIGVGGTDDEFFMLNDENKTLYPIGDLNVWDYMGRNVEFNYSSSKSDASDKADDEKKEIVSAIKLADCTEIDTTIGAIVIKDGELKVGSDVIIKKADLADYRAYVFQNGDIDEENIKIGTEKNAAGTETNLYGWLDFEANRTGFDFQNVTFVVNTKAKIVSLIYNPVVFWKVDSSMIKEKIEKNQYTGEYYYDADSDSQFDEGDINVPAVVNTLPNGTWVAASLSGNTASVVGFPQTVDYSKINAVKTKDGYAFTVNGETAVYAADTDALYFNAAQKPTMKTDAEFFAALVGSGTALVYNNWIIAVELTATQGNTQYAYVVDYTASISGGKIVYTVDAIVNSALTQITVKADGLRDTNGTSKLTTLAQGDIFVISTSSEEKDGLEIGDTILTKQTKTAARKIAQFVTALNQITLGTDTIVKIPNAVLIGIDVKAGTTFDPSQLVVIGEEATLAGKKIVKDSLTVEVVGSDDEAKVIVVYYTIG